MPRLVVVQAPGLPRRHWLLLLLLLLRRRRHCHRHLCSCCLRSKYHLLLSCLLFLLPLLPLHLFLLPALPSKLFGLSGPLQPSRFLHSSPLQSRRFLRSGSLQPLCLGFSLGFGLRFALCRLKG